MQDQQYTLLCFKHTAISGVSQTMLTCNGYLLNSLINKQLLKALTLPFFSATPLSICLSITC